MTYMSCGNLWARTSDIEITSQSHKFPWVNIEGTLDKLNSPHNIFERHFIPFVKYFVHIFFTDHNVYLPNYIYTYLLIYLLSTYQLQRYMRSIYNRNIKLHIRWCNEKGGGGWEGLVWRGLVADF